jgi:6-phosphofructo-2-kinase/fructose-2,6-biphosphatase 4
MIDLIYHQINPGVIDGMSVAEIKEKYPDEYEKSLTEPYAHRYPRAESYHDLSVRLEPIIFVSPYLASIQPFCQLPGL